MKEIRKDWQEIGHRVAVWMAAQGWNKSRFAAEMDIHRQHVNKYLNGILNPERLFLRLAEHGCDLTWLRTGKPANTDTPVIFTPEQAKMLRFLQDVGITTAEELQQIYKLHTEMEVFIQHYHLVKERLRTGGDNEK